MTVLIDISFVLHICICLCDLQRGDTALMAAAKNGHDECVSMLISAGANVHAVTKAIVFSTEKKLNVSISFFRSFSVVVSRMDGMPLFMPM